MRGWKLSLVLFCLLVWILTACAQEPTTYTLAPYEALPDFVSRGDAFVRDAYRFAIANPQALETVPCYCGCGSMGHDSNLACYVQDIAADGTMTFDSHAVTCNTCLAITHDVMDMMEQHYTPRQIRDAIDAEYASVGPGTDTRMPAG